MIGHTCRIPAMWSIGEACAALCARAVRIVLAGGYVEEIETGHRRVWRPAMVGIVRPSLSHRIASLINSRVSYSLWVRAPKTAPIALRGDGWHSQKGGGA